MAPYYCLYSPECWYSHDKKLYDIIHYLFSPRQLILNFALIFIWPWDSETLEVNEEF